MLKHTQSSSEKYNIVLHCANDGPLVQALQREGFRVITFGKSLPHASLLMKAYNRLLFYIKYMVLLNQFKPDLIYSNTIVNFSQVILGRIMGAKTLVHMHEGRDFVSRARLRLKFSSFFTTKYIVGSRYVSDVLRKYVGVDGVVIYNGVKVSESSKNISKRQQSSFVLCVIGTIDRNKAQLIAVKAVEYLAEVKSLDIQLKLVGRIGDSEYGDELKDYIEKMASVTLLNLLGVLKILKTSIRIQMR